jgi:hypothetical protein
LCIVLKGQELFPSSERLSGKKPTAGQAKITHSHHYQSKEVWYNAQWSLPPVLDQFVHLHGSAKEHDG